MTYTPDTPLEALAGIGPKKAQAFQKLGVATPVPPAVRGPDAVSHDRGRAAR